MTKLTQDAVLARIRQLPSLPTVVVELLASLEDDDIDVDALVGKVAHDQALVAKTLRVANSSFYGLQGQVETLHDALVVLGFRQVRTLVVAASINASIPGGKQNEALNRLTWQHGLLVAMCARELAKYSGIHADGAYTAGLLHDIGRLALAGCFASEYAEVNRYRDEHDCFHYEAERDVLGIDHAEVGMALAARWNLPQAIAEPIGLHHEPRDSGSKTLADVIHVADVMAHALDLTQTADELVPRLHASAWNRLGLDWARFKACLMEVENHGRELQAFSMT